MAGVSGKARRLLEITSLTLRLTRDFQSRAALVSCFAGAMHDPNSRVEATLRILWNGAIFPITIRQGDIFTLGEIFFDREYDIVSAVPPNPVVVDCGANVGLSPIWFLASFPGASVHAIEPEPENFRLLTMNVGSRNDVIVTQAAVTQESGTVALSVAEHGAMHSVKDRGVGARTITVPAVNLGDYCRQKGLDRVDLLKLDIEGSELDVLESLGDVLSRVRIVVGELHESLVDDGRFYRFAEASGFRRVKRQAARETGVHLFEIARV
jgi:FkbM family methyltransferase